METVNVDIPIEDLQGNRVHAAIRVDVPALFIVPDTIDRSGGADVTTPLNTWLRSVPNGPTPTNPNVIRFRPGTYRHDSTIFLRTMSAATIGPKSNTIIELGDATFDNTRNTNGNAPAWRGQQSKNVDVVGGRIVGANPRAGAREDAFVQAMQWQHGWRMEACESFHLIDPIISDVYGDFVCAEGFHVGAAEASNKDIVIQNPDFRRNGRQAMSYTAGDGLLVDGGIIDQVRMTLLDLEAEWNTLPIRNVTMRRVKMGQTFLTLLGCTGICNGGVSEVHIEDNVQIPGTDGGVPVFDGITPTGCVKRGPIYIERNRFWVRGSPLAAIHLIGWHDAYVRNNIAQFAYDSRLPRVFVDAVGSQPGIVSGNKLYLTDARNQIQVLRKDAGSAGFVDGGGNQILAGRAP